MWTWLGCFCVRALSSLHDMMTVNERIGYLTQLAAVCHWCVRTYADQRTVASPLLYNWGEPERAPHKRYSCARIVYIYIMVRRSREIIYPVMLYGHKREIFYCAFSCLGHGPYIRRSNLANCNCKFTLELDQASCRTAPYRSKQKVPKEETLSEIEPVISSIGQGPAKNTIKID